MFTTLFKINLMKIGVKIQLMLMMFLMFFTWGAWYGQITKYLQITLGATPIQSGNAFATLSIATLISPFFVALIADRYFSAQKVMGILNILGAIVLYFLIDIQDPGIFFWYILAYTLTFAPNLALSTSIAMNQMKNPEKEFSNIRVFGTIAWIVVGLIIGNFKLGDSVTIFKISMVTSLILGIYSFFLPDTPPKSDKSASFASIIGADAFVLFKDRSFVIFFISSILICIPLTFYYNLANSSLTASSMSNVESKMSLGQVSEIVFMLVLPFLYQKIGIKKILILGLIAWILRFICFGYGDGIKSEWILYIAIILHGICYDFFFVSGQIYTENKANEKIRNSAQALITLATYGIGMLIGSQLSGLVQNHYSLGSGIYDYRAIWMVPAAIAAVVLVLFVLFFRDNDVKG
jgi:nucleoside transporter